MAAPLFQLNKFTYLYYLHIKQMKELTLQKILFLGFHITHKFEF